PAVPAAGCARSMDLQEWDETLNQGWFDLAAGLPPGSPAINVDTYPGHTYAFRARAHDIYGRTDDWTPAPVTVSVPGNATLAHAFAGLYTLDGFGGVHPVDSAPLGTTAYWSGWKIAHGLAELPGGQPGGDVLDAFGGLHPCAIGTHAMPATPATTAYWSGWAIARGVALVPGTNTGYVLDGWGGLHPFNGAPAVAPGAYWPKWDIARGLW